jgi:acyl transferase domain-containing protein
MNNVDSKPTVEGIAVIGLGGRFPGARNLDEFWQNLCGGVESISRFSEQELKMAGMDPSLTKLPGFVNAGCVLHDIDQFDALFFGYSARDAEAIDPQQRLFLECAWECLESAGYDSELYPGMIGVFAGSDMSSYIYQVYAHTDSQGGGMALIGNDKDYLTTQVSYKLNLRGPSVAVQSSCSTSLVAVCLACQNLWSYSCDMVLAGGVAVGVPQKKGYFYQPGGILSPDGHCRTFDADGQGTVVGNGVGIVLLKRLSDALADGDTIHAVVRGAALNNDGSAKVGYTAPSVGGQAQAITIAQTMAGIDPGSISYVEAHGTATLLGDPIEVAALTEAFAARRDKKHFCALGSVKSNVGHLASAAGVTGFIKTVLALENEKLPPSLHFKTPNPQLDFVNGPFYVNDKLSEWKRNSAPRRAGVSSFGVGGTNAHVVLEEAPPAAPAGPSRPFQLLQLSARSSAALENATTNLAEHLKLHPELNLADVAYTQANRRTFSHRRILVCSGVDDAAAALASRDSQRILTAATESHDRPVLFMFSGQGAQYVDMGRGLYESEPAFRREMDRCCDLLQPHLGFDLREVLYPAPDNREKAVARLLQTGTTQPALFALEYSLAQLWIEFGVIPKGMIGHSIGEYVAACLAGVFTLEDALDLVAVRGRLMEQMPPGSMLVVPLSEADVQTFLREEVSLAAVNGPTMCVLSGPTAAIERVEAALAERAVQGRRLHTSHAFHSSMMDPVLRPFLQKAQGIRMSPPVIPFLSNVTGNWMLAPDANYWSQHLRQTVRFAAGLSEVLKYPDLILLEVGPGQTLSTLARMHPSKSAAEQLIVSSVRSSQDQQPDEEFLLNTLGRLWLDGALVNWPEFYRHARRRRIPLPTYPFERQRYWVGPVEEPASTLAAPQQREVSDWFYKPAWKRVASIASPRETGKRWLVIGQDESLMQRLEHNGKEVMQVESAGDYNAIIRSGTPDVVVHLLNVDSSDGDFDHHQSRGFYSLLSLGQALEKNKVTSPVQIVVVANRLHAVVNGDAVSPSKATLLGPCKVLPQEYPNIRCKSIDIDGHGDLAETVVGEVMAEPFDTMVAYRNGQRWVRQYDPYPIAPSDGVPSLLRKNGVYFITGGLGNIGLEIAGTLAQLVQARLVLVGRSADPMRKDERLRKIEELGGEVLVVRADCADRRQMQVAVDQAYARFGAINGVIHGAGNTSTEAFPNVSRTDQSTGEAHFAPKARGLIVLEELFRDRDVDFVLLLSSLSGVLGGLGLLTYASANIFLDAFAEQQNGMRRVPWVSVNWDAWQFPGQEGLFRKSNEFIYPAEGMECLRHILHEAPGQVVVSASNLQVRIDKWIKLESLHQPQKSQKQSAGVSLHPRPNLGSQFVPPRNEVEQKVADIWQNILGVGPIGVFDKFFELGGHSLLAIQLISRMREAFQVELSAQRLFEAPTVAQLAETIQADLRDAKQALLQDEEKMTEMLNLVESMSDAEVAELLDKANESAKEHAANG